MRTAMSQELKEKSKLTKQEWKEYTKTVWLIANVTHPVHPAVFPLEIPHRLIKLFTFVCETVLDPFAGVGTTAIAALKIGRNAICIEQNSDYVQIIKENIEQIKSEIALDLLKQKNTIPYSSLKVDIKQGDCRQLLRSMDENSVSLIVTSPPYWNKASYNDTPENIGKIEGYSDFLREIRPAFEECFRILMPGRKICIITANVNQYTDQGLLTFPLAADFTLILREIGFVMVNELVWCKYGTGGKWGSWGNQRPIFGSYPYPPNFLFKNVHEYILVFAKPSKEKRKGKKAKKLEILYDTKEKR